MKHRHVQIFPQALRPMAVAFLAVSSPARSAVDESRIPSAATNTIDFVRDVRPILEAHCVKCHGSEKPKSGFRVDDRAMMLKGGDGGVSVLAGQGARSSLIHYVAGLVPDMEMPPRGKGEPLTPAQVGVLRAWIDQGVTWGGEAPARTMVEVAPTLRWISIDGNERKFRELEWMRDGWDGGLEKFLVREQISPERRVTVEGYALRDDHEVQLSVEDGRRWFVHAGFQQHRKWFSNEGGFYRGFTPPVASLDRDLFLDWGKAWMEVGGTLPSGLQLLAGYEFQFKDGEKSMTQWLPSTQTLTAGDATRSLLPTSKSIDEQVHVLRLEGLIEWPHLRVEDRFRYELSDLKTRHSSVLNAFPFTIFTQRIHERDLFKTLANSFTTELAPEEWLLLSAGYLYRRMDGTSDFGQRPVDAAGNLGQGLLWNTRGVPLEQAGHVFNANLQIGPWQDLSATAGIQAEWNRQESFGRVRLDETDPGDPSLVVTNPASIQGNYDRFTLQENAGVRFTGLPYTVLYGDARWQQEAISQFESMEADGAPGPSDFLRDTDARYDWQQYRAGFNTSPWSRVALNGSYQHRIRDDSFDHQRDERPIGVGGAGYPAFITARETISDEAALRLVVRPMSWLKTTLSYRVIATDFRTDTDAGAGPFATPGGWNLAGNYDAHIYSLGLTMTPWRRLYLYGSFSFQDSRTVANANGNAAIALFKGNIYSALASASYILAEPTDLHLTYDFSHADYSQNNAASGLPLGIDYQRHGLRLGLSHRFWKRFFTRLEYAWFLYDEPSSGGFGDYLGHGVFATLNMRWP